MQTKIIYDELEYVKKIRSYTVDFTLVDGEGDKIGTKNITLEFTKMIEEGNNTDYDNDYQFEPESQKIFDALEETQQDEIIDYINDLTI